MAEKMLKTRIQNKHETEANWSQATGFVPLAGELIIYDVDETHSKPRFKIGDGVRNPDTGKVEGTNVNDLPFVSDDFITNDELDAKLNNEYHEKFATVDQVGVTAITSKDSTPDSPKPDSNVSGLKVTPIANTNGVGTTVNVEIDDTVTFIFDCGGAND